MIDWLIFIIPPLVIILILVLIQFQWTRRAMAKFAKRHAMTYKKPRRLGFSIGEISGEIGRAAFFMGMMSKNYGFGPVAKYNYPKRKIPYMHIKVEGMPEKLVIRSRRPGISGNIIEVLSRKTGIPMLKTGNEAFDSRFDVAGYKEEVLPWLTAQRRETIADFLSLENYVVSKGGMAYTTGKTYINLNDMEQAFERLTAALRKI